MEQAVQKARRAERVTKGARTDYYWEELNERLKERTRAIREARTRAWRNRIQEASEAKDPEGMWALERWARLRSFLPPEPPRLPALQDYQGQAVVTDHEQKAEALARRFSQTLQLT